MPVSSWIAAIVASQSAPGRVFSDLSSSNAYTGYVLALATKYGSPEKRETRYYRNGVETGSSGEQVWWSKGNQYMQGSEIERAITIGSAVLDAQIAEAERLHERN